MNFRIIFKEPQIRVTLGIEHVHIKWECKLLCCFTVQRRPFVDDRVKYLCAGLCKSFVYVALLATNQHRGVVAYPKLKSTLHDLVRSVGRVVPRGIAPETFHSAGEVVLIASEPGEMEKNKLNSFSGIFSQKAKFDELLEFSWLVLFLNFEMCLSI